jgi:hypothetical protein
MATETATTSVDIQRLLTGAAKLELKALIAGVEYWQTWINQAAKFSNIASDTLNALEQDKASLSDTMRRFTDFGKDNTQVFAALSNRLGQAYYEELGRFTEGAAKKIAARKARHASRAEVTPTPKARRRKRASK